MNGEIQAIFICPSAGEEMQPVSEVRAVPGKGLEGDRYFNRRDIILINRGTGGSSP